MKLTLFFVSSLIFSNVYASGTCDQIFSTKNSKKFECQSTGAESSIVTSEGRIIFVSKTACLELEDKSVSVSLETPSNGKLKLDIKKLTDSGLEASKSERVYPSGNIVKSYLVEDSLKVTELNSDAPKLNVKKVNKKTFKKDELRYLGNYTCTEVK